MPRIVPEPRPGEEIVGEIERNEGAYWLVGASAASVPLIAQAANVPFAPSALLDLTWLVWGLLVPLWILSISFALSKRKTYYLTNLRLVEVSPFTERSLDLEEMDLVHLRDHLLGVPALPNPFGSTLVFRKRGHSFRGRLRIPYVKNPQRVIEAVDTAVSERRVALNNVAHRPRAVPRRAGATR